MLLHNFKAGRRNYTIFQVGKETSLRVSDGTHGDPLTKTEPYVRVCLSTTRKTVKSTYYLKPVQQDLVAYQAWCLEHHSVAEWLFFSIQRPDRCITEKQFYKIMSKMGDFLGINT